MKYQGISISLLEEHKGIVYIFVIVISIYVATIIVGKKLGLIRLLSATIAPILLFFILVPELGWPALGLWVILAAKLAWDYLRQLYHYLLHQASHVFNSFATTISLSSSPSKSCIQLICHTHKMKSKIGAIVAERSRMGPSFLPTIIVATEELVVERSLKLGALYLNWFGVIDGPPVHGQVRKSTP